MQLSRSSNTKGIIFPHGELCNDSDSFQLIYWDNFFHTVSSLKGQCHEIFYFRLSPRISFPQAPVYTRRVVLNFFEYSRRFAAQGALPVSFFHTVSNLKGQCHEIFYFRLSTRISFPQAPVYTIRVVSNFFEHSRRFAAQCALPVSLTPVANGKNLN